MNHRNSVGKGAKGHEKGTKDSKGAAFRYMIFKSSAPLESAEP